MKVLFFLSALAAFTGLVIAGPIPGHDTVIIPRADLGTEAPTFEQAKRANAGTRDLNIDLSNLDINGLDNLVKDAQNLSQKQSDDDDDDSVS